ncbi:MAG TPA: hypothetical protein VNV64_06155 [Candidatus Binatia bacterium]|nr:hypothetical protein [Candidatus Binatia bacterium]
MTEPNEPKKETTRIPVAPEVAEKPPEPNAKSRDTVRIQLPLREAPVHILTEPQPAVQEGGSPQFFQPPQPPSVPLNTAVMPAPDLPSSGPIKETVRIPLPAVQAKKNQPLVAMPEVAPQGASIAVTAEERNPMPLLWLLLGVSALILIIQIWTYLS